MVLFNIVTFMVLTPCIFLNQYIKNALNKIQFMISVNLLYVSAPGFHIQGFFQNEGVQVQYAILSIASLAH